MTTFPRSRVLLSALVLAPPLVLSTGVTAAHAAAPAPAPAAVAVAPARPPGTVTVAATKTVSIVTQEQQTSYWCAPAAGRALLSRFIKKKYLPSQKTIAGWMKTKPPKGTKTHNIPTGLNRAHSGHEFINTHPRSSGDLWTHINNAVGRHGWVMGGRILVGAKPWGRPSSDKDGHIIVAYGYSTSGGKKTIYWWDPADNSRHKASLAASWKAINKAGKNLIG